MTLTPYSAILGWFLGPNRGISDTPIHWSYCSDHGPAAQGRRELDNHVIPGDVCREDFEAPPPLFCRYLYLALHLVWH